MARRSPRPARSSSGGRTPANERQGPLLKQALSRLVRRELLLDAVEVDVVGQTKRATATRTFSSCGDVVVVFFCTHLAILSRTEKRRNSFWTSRRYMFFLFVGSHVWLTSSSVLFRSSNEPVIFASSRQECSPSTRRRTPRLLLLAIQPILPKTDEARRRAWHAGDFSVEGGAASLAGAGPGVNAPSMGLRFSGRFYGRHLHAARAEQGAW